MGLDNVMWKKSAMSMPQGRLHLLENGDIAFTQYKTQNYGRVGILAYLVILLINLFRKDKVVLTISKSDVVSAGFTQGERGKALGIGTKYHTINIMLLGGTVQEFYGPPEANAAAYAQFVREIKAQPGNSPESA